MREKERRLVARFVMIWSGDRKHKGQCKATAVCDASTGSDRNKSEGTIESVRRPPQVTRDMPCWE